MNKYLIKIAEDKKKGYGLETIGALGGVGVAKHQYHNGHLTGRTTYYHGSSEPNIEKIKQEGIFPRKSKGIIDKFKDAGMESFEKDNEGLSFATKSKNTAHFYAEQSRHIHNGTYKLPTEDPFHQIRTLRNATSNYISDSIGLRKDKGMVRLNIPTWKDEVKSKTVRNPELDSVHIKAMPDFQRKKFEKELGDNTLTHKGVISPKFIKNSPHYQRNTSKEILTYIKHNPKRFAKGTGLAVAGLGLTGAAIASAYSKHRKKD